MFNFVQLSSRFDKRNYDGRYQCDGKVKQNLADVEFATQKNKQQQ